MTLEHVDHPHEPGALRNCPACESECFCDGGLDCVYCTGTYVDNDRMMELEREAGL